MQISDAAFRLCQFRGQSRQLLRPCRKRCSNPFQAAQRGSRLSRGTLQSIPYVLLLAFQGYALGRAETPAGGALLRQFFNLSFSLVPALRTRQRDLVQIRQLILQSLLPV